jgi:hypothetical protein
MVKKKIRVGAESAGAAPSSHFYDNAVPFGGAACREPAREDAPKILACFNI